MSKDKMTIFCGAYQIDSTGKKTPVVMTEEEKKKFAKGVDRSGEYNVVVCDSDAISKMMAATAAILSINQS